MPVITNLIGYWSLEEASGTAADAHGARSLSDATSTTGTTGKVGNGRTFVAASTQVLTHTDHADLSLGADVAFSWAFWMKIGTPPGSGQRGVISKYENGGSFPFDYQVRYDFDNSRIELVVTGGGTDVTCDGTVAVSTGVWTFVVAKHDPVANLLTVTVNDQATPATLSHSTGTTDTVGALNIGGDVVGGVYFDGMLDEVGFWKKALTTSEITWLYNAGAGRSYADIVAEAGGGNLSVSSIGEPVIGGSTF